MRRIAQMFAACGACWTLACASSPTISTELPPGHPPTPVEDLPPEVVADYQAALDVFVKNDRATWSESSCSEVANQFVGVSKTSIEAGKSPLPQAHYNAGLALQRCGLHDEAKKHFKQALQLDGSDHRSQTQLTLYRLQETGDVNAAIFELEKTIVDARFQNVDALIALASLQMRRADAQAKGQRCSGDLECARLNIQRALAIDDRSMPAFNQLSLYYLQRATGKLNSGLELEGVSSAQANERQLELASLVVEQAIARDASYAPLYNTKGLIYAALGDYNVAVLAFKKARKKNPELFEAQMNYAAVNFAFRNFPEAASAYREAISLRPETYEAHLGLALAHRSMMNHENHKKHLPLAQEHLDIAKKLKPERPEAYFNEAKMTEEYRTQLAVGDEEQKRKAFLDAQAQYKLFVEKAGSDPLYTEAVKTAKNKIEDIDAILDFSFVREPLRIKEKPKG